MGISQGTIYSTEKYISFFFHDRYPKYFLSSFPVVTSVVKGLVCIYARALYWMKSEMADSVSLIPYF